MTERLYYRDLRPLLYLLIPFVVLLLVVDVAPLLLGAWSSTRQLDLRTLQNWLSAPFHAHTNYSDAVTGNGGLTVSALRAVWQTVEFALAATLIAVPIGVLAALSVSERHSWVTTVVRAIYILPVAMPLFSTAYVWRMILQPQSGLLDQVQKAIVGGKPSNHLLLGGHSMAALIAVDVWFAWGFVFLFALAGLQSITRELYEAAAIDGATWWHKFRYVAYPGLRRVLIVAIILSTLNHYNDFTLPYVLFGTSPPGGVIVVPVETYLAGFSLFNFGLADAVAIVGLIGIIIPVFAYLWVAGAGRRAEVR